MSDDDPSVFGTKKLKPQTEAYARRDDPDTSEEAARKISFTNTEQIVLDVFEQFPGRLMTSLCITRLLADRGDNRAWSVSPRLAPLERKGMIERCGKMTVTNSNGNPASLTAWRLRQPKTGADVVYLRSASNAA